MEIVVDELGALNQLRSLSRLLAEVIEKQERVEMMRGETSQGYLMISDGTPAAKVVVQVQGYGKRGERLVAIEQKTLPPVTESPEEA